MNRHWEWKTTKGSNHTLCTIIDTDQGKAVARGVSIENARLITKCVNAAGFLYDDSLTDKDKAK